MSNSTKPITSSIFKVLLIVIIFALLGVALWQRGIDPMMAFLPTLLSGAVLAVAATIYDQKKNSLNPKSAFNTDQTSSNQKKACFTPKENSSQQTPEFQKIHELNDIAKDIREFKPEPDENADFILNRINVIKDKFIEITRAQDIPNQDDPKCSEICSLIPELLTLLVYVPQVSRSSDDNNQTLYFHYTVPDTSATQNLSDKFKELFSSAQKDQEISSSRAGLSDRQVQTLSDHLKQSSITHLKISINYLANTHQFEHIGLPSTIQSYYLNGDKMSVSCQNNEESDRSPGVHK